MAQQTINVGTAPNDGTGTPLRTAFQYTNSNFTELYTATGPSGNNINVPGAATITGNLTVDTNTLFVDSANNRVGVGTVTPAAAIAIDLPEVSSAAGTSAIIYNNTGGGNRIAALRLKNLSNQWNIRAYGSVTDDLRFSSGSTGSEVDYLSIGNTGIFTWSNVGGVAGTAMTLNSTGLGVGVTPTLEKLQINGGIVLSPPAIPATLTTNGQLTVNATSNTNLRFSYRGSDGVTRVANITLA